MQLLNAPSVLRLSVYPSIHLINRQTRPSIVPRFHKKKETIYLSPPQTRPSIVPRFHTKTWPVYRCCLKKTQKQNFRAFACAKKNGHVTTVLLLPKQKEQRKETWIQGLSLSHKVLKIVLLRRNTNNNNNNNTTNNDNSKNNINSINKIIMIMIIIITITPPTWECRGVWRFPRTNSHYWSPQTNCPCMLWCACAGTSARL